MAGGSGRDRRWDWLYRVAGLDPEKDYRPPPPPSHIFDQSQGPPRSTEPPKSAPSAAPESQGRITALLIFLAGNAIGDPLCIAAGDRFVKHEWSEAVFGFGIGIPLVAIAWIYPFRTELLTPRLRASIEAHAYRWWPVAVLLAFIYVVGPDIYRRATAPISPPPIVQGFTQQQVDEKIADALKTEKAKTPPATIIHDPPTQEQIDKAAKPLVDEAVRKRDEAEQALRAERAKPSSTARVAELEARVRELEAQPPLAGAPLGPATTMSMISQLGVEGPGMGVRGPSPAKFHWAIVFTAPQQDERIRPFLTSLLATAGMDVLPLRPADHSVNLDAPEFPEPGNAGITLHGENVLNARLLEVLRPCLIVRATAKTVDRLEWYRSSLKEQDRIIVWIEIGNGEPWTRERRCWM